MMSSVEAAVWANVFAERLREERKRMHRDDGGGYLPRRVLLDAAAEAAAAVGALRSIGRSRMSFHEEDPLSGDAREMLEFALGRGR